MRIKNPQFSFLSCRNLSLIFFSNEMEKVTKTWLHQLLHRVIKFKISFLTNFELFLPEFGPVDTYLSNLIWNVIQTIKIFQVFNTCYANTNCNCTEIRYLSHQTKRLRKNLHIFFKSLEIIRPNNCYLANVFLYTYTKRNKYSAL